MERLYILGMPETAVEQAIKEATRKSGTLKVALLERYARWLLESAGRR